MTKRMLIDATHPEETRVVLLDGNQLENFDVEVSSRRQLKGNIYLAKVVRVEPSLQAAFVDYGGNRHGFLAFSEIHPDYYQIPVSDREEALAVQSAAEDVSEETTTPAESEAVVSDDEVSNGTAEATGGGADETVETVGGDDVAEIEETHKRVSRQVKHYKIQEVIKRRQVLLIQVVKEERGNKGAALTTYLSLAGRYCVLMPNTARGGGISRKITNPAERKQLKAILSDLDVPEGMAVILRTAGIGRTKAEIKRDFEYLIRLWNQVRNLTLESSAPTLVHEEGDIVRRTIRDLYSRDIEDVQVEGEEAYRAAKDFMKLLIPSHARRVKQYKGADAPIFRHFGVEGQLDAIHNPIAHLRSGGYIVINPTEALVSIDVNSGRATKERNIEETALKTNLEAADEVARQLRLRDLAGLIVIDFIDMEVNRNNAQVERRMKDALKNDRARIQVGRISPFGLLEMSRQRMRPSLIETSSEPCPYCGGTGIRRSTESTALVVLRAIDEEGAQRRAQELTVHVPTAVALYILNYKRDALAELEAKYAMAVVLVDDDSLIPPDLHMERTKNLNGETISEMVATTRTDTSDDLGSKRRRRRRGRKRGEGDEVVLETAQEPHDTAVEETAGEGEVAAEEDKPKRRRRSRRGGRRRRKNADAVQQEETKNNEPGQTDVQGAVSAQDNETPSEGVETVAPEASVETVAAIAGDDEKSPPKRRRSRRRRKPAGTASSQDVGTASSQDSAPVESGKAPVQALENATVQDKGKPAVEPVSQSTPKPAPLPSVQGVETVVVGSPDTTEKPKRKGWWNLER